MKKEQSVFNKLHKFSVKEEAMKVELSNVNELAQFTKQIIGRTSTVEDSHNSAQREVNVVKKAKQDAKQYVKSLVSAVNGLSADIERLDGAMMAFKRNAQELGINPKEVREAVVAEKAIALGKDTVAKYSRFADDMAKSLMG